jgi:cysteine desulfurase / selenocysteine lyase
MNTAAAAGLGVYVYTDTPGKSKTMHFNNAGSSLMPKVVLDAQVGYLNLEATIGGYEAVIQCQEELDAVYTSVARLVGADSPEEIALTESATVGWAQAFYSIPFQPGDRILCVEQEYISNYLAYLQIAKEKGVIIEIIPIDSVGDVCLASLDRMLKEGRVKVVSITHIPTNSGLVHDVKAIGAVVKAADADIIYFVDACQSAGQIPLDVNDIKCK